MKSFVAIICSLLSVPCLFAQAKKISDYNVVWTSQSKDASGSMPCGGGDIGLNVWVENGDMLFYMSRSGSFDENNAMLKLGRIRLRLSPNPFNGVDFKQELKLEDGGVVISGGGTFLKIWVDVFHPVIHVDMESKKLIKIEASYETWRSEDHIVQGTEFRTNSYKAPQKFVVATFKDQVDFKKNELIFYHRNRADVENIFDYTVKMEGMSSVKDLMFNPVVNNTFGGIVSSSQMKASGVDSGTYAGIRFKSWNFESIRPSRSQQITIGLHVQQSTTLETWLSGLDSMMKMAQQAKLSAQQKTHHWWKDFWNRSYIFIDGKDSFVSRNYQLFRYQLGCNAYGKWPTKFNGGLFTFDPVYVDEKYNYSPDFRLWGGGTMTAQNQRLVYFPMIKSGDFDMLQSQFDFYLRSQKNAELRSQFYWKHNGACFTEQVENFGLPNITEYVIKRPEGYDAGMEYNAWLEYEWETVFEFCLMMLETERYESRDITTHLPFIESCLTFFDEHYQQLAKQRGNKAFDQNGKYILFPSSAAETFKMTYNSTTLISALQIILQRVLELPEKYLTQPQKDKWQTMLKRVPALPFQSFAGHKTLAPAQAWERVQNTETPQLYPVYPWGIYGVGRPDLQTAIDTYEYDTLAVKFRSHVGWRQHNIFAARLGLTNEAQRLAKLKFEDSRHRFPTFWGPGFDWTPDHNWGGAAMIGLQEMLMQVNGKKIYLLPAWPKDWNGSFKLHAPSNTTVEGKIENGKMKTLNVMPKEREKDVVVM